MMGAMPIHTGVASSPPQHDMQHKMDQILNGPVPIIAKQFQLIQS
jgi:hypothetical protein